MNVRYYIECYYADGTQILGNLDGQAVIRVANYKRDERYKQLRNIVGNPNWMNGKVACAKVVTKSGQVVETVR